MLILFLFLSSIAEGSIQQNRFISMDAIAQNWSTSKNTFVIPPYIYYNTSMPGKPNGALASEDIESIKVLLSKKQAYLAFENYNSMVYFVYFILNLPKANEKIQNRYSKMFAEATQHNDVLFSPNQTSSRPYKLLQALQDASNEVNVNDSEKFLETTLTNFYNFKPSTTTAPLFNKDDSVFGRLKRAFRFEWNTFLKPKEKYTQEEINEDWANTPYITFVHFASYAITVVVGSVLVRKIFNYLDSKK